MNRILEAHWINPDRLKDDLFAEFFVERGQAMFDLITQTMGKLPVDRRQVFQDALGSVGLETEYDDDDEVEYDPVGESAYTDVEVAADD